VHEGDTLSLLPVHGARTQWYKNLQKNSSLTIKVGNEERTSKARQLTGAPAVGKVIQSFRKKYTPDIITKLYPGPLDAAVKNQALGSSTQEWPANAVLLEAPK